MHQKSPKDSPWESQERPRVAHEDPRRYGKPFLEWIKDAEYIRIIIEAKTGPGYRSDISIDTLQLENIEHAQEFPQQWMGDPMSRPPEQYLRDEEEPREDMKI